MPRWKTTNNYKTFSKMPKRKRKQNSRKKEKQAIQTRLIDISMKIEDHIYHKAQISESEAQMFIREVSSYKTECSAEERSLQVIEKIVRCMRAVIAEHQEQNICCTRNDEQYDDENRTIASSPVYSLPDEDRTQLTQPYTDNNITKNIDDHNRFERTDALNNVKDDTLDKNTKAVEIINLCDDDDKENNSVGATKSLLEFAVTPEKDADVNIHNALSNLSIRDVNTSDIRMDTDTECSQSILNNYQVIDNVLQNNTSTTGFTGFISINNGKLTNRVISQVQNRQDTVPNQTPTALTQVAKIVKPIIVNSNNQNRFHSLNNPLVGKVSNAINNTCNNSKKQFIADQNRHSITVANPVYKKNIEHQNSIPPLNNNTPLTNKTRDSEISKTKNMFSTKSSHGDDNDDNNKPTTMKRKRAPRKMKSTETKTQDNAKLTIQQKTERINIENVPKPKRKYTRKITNEKKDISIPIYNKNVVNDLSWLENIRYVREIAEEEYKATDLRENFWDNYLLPPNFDENDFL